MRSPTVLTVIVNYRTPELTLKAAGAARRQMADLDGEIVIVDNASGDDSVDMLRRALDQNGWSTDGRVRLVVSDRNAGFGAGNNLAMRAGLADGSRPDYVYLLNSDAWPDPGALRRLVNFMQANPKAGIVGSHVRGTDDAPHRTAFRFPSIGGEFEAAARTGVISGLLERSIVAIPIPERETRVDWCAGASLMLRDRMLAEIGLFDETFFLYFEETDLCNRAAQAGWRTHYLPESGVVHVGSASTGMKTWTRTPPYWFDSRLHYFVKTRGWLYWGVATGARIAGSLIWRLRRLVQDKPQGDPDRFLRDLIAHSARAILRRRPAPGTLPRLAVPPATSPAAPTTEDSK